MDILYGLHLLILLGILSIPFWPKAWLMYGVYVPITISLIWVVFDGCPLTKYQTNLSSKSFTKEVYSIFVPNITVKMADNVNTFAFILITMIGMHRLCRKNWQCVAWLMRHEPFLNTRAIPQYMSHFSIIINDVIIVMNISQLQCLRNEKS